MVARLLVLATPELIAAIAQRDRLAGLLPRCREEVPLYRGLWRAIDFSAGAPVPGNGMWSQLPCITKREIRTDFPRNFLAATQDLDDLVEREVVELEHTSGTSEVRTALLLPRGWWAEQERRALELHPVPAEVFRRNEKARRVTISSPVCSGDICYTGVPSRSDRILGQALHLSLSRFPFLWGRAELDRMAAEALDWAPEFLDLDPVYGVIFALHCEQYGVRLPSLKFILCSYEFISVVHRRILQRVFGVPVLNLYGSTETGHLLMEDGSGWMRPSLETAFLEVVDPDHAGIGELVVSTLTNPFMPLIRYRIGDLVESSEQSACMRYLVHGRVADAFQTPDGTRVTTLQIDRCFASLDGIAHYQLIERQPGPWLLRYVPDHSAPAPADLERLRQELTTLLRLAQPLELHATDALVPESSGKFRLGYPMAKRPVARLQAAG